MKSEISISRKIIRAIVWILIIAVILVGAALALRTQPDLLAKMHDRIQGNGSASSSTQIAGDAQAAATGVEAIYTLDFGESSEQYQERVCKTMTTDGCKFFQTMLVPAIRMTVEQKQVKTGCTVSPVQMVQEDGKSRIWLVAMTLDHPWEGMVNPSQLYAEVVQTDGVWLLNRILFDQETARFKTPTP